MACMNILLQRFFDVKGVVQIKSKNIHFVASDALDGKRLAHLDFEMDYSRDGSAEMLSESEDSPDEDPMYVYGSEPTVIVDVDLRKKFKCRCPDCNRKCPVYDNNSGKLSVWRAPDLNNIRVLIRAHLPRINCPEHHVKVAGVPWAYKGSRFTKGFERYLALLAINTSRKFTANMLRVDWKTVGRCIDRVHDDVEYDPKKRCDNLVHIGIDETSFQKGHKYLTVVVNLCTNTAVWVHEGSGKEVIDEFFKSLTEAQRNSIKIVAGDGAQWITSAAKEWCPNATRCVDLFHVVEWTIDAVDNVRTNIWRDLQNQAKSQAQEEKQNDPNAEEGQKKKRGRKKKTDKQGTENGVQQKLASAITKEEAEKIKKMKYALGKNPEHLTDYQHAQLQYLVESNPTLYDAYLLKEELRVILKNIDVQEAETELNAWYEKVSEHNIPEMIELAEKIKRNQTFILNSIETKFSSSKVEAMNNKIKLIIRKAYGFRDFNSLKSMILLVCSNLTIPLPNRGINVALRAG